MSWPTPQDYNEAVQNPRLAICDSDLQIGQPELNQLGIPRPRCGTFACVYKFQTGGHAWAARCFLRDIPDLQPRYEAISQCLTNAKLPYTVPFTYIPSGIKVRGRSYPILKMKWIQGESLNTFVGKTLAQPGTLLSIGKALLKITRDLKALNIAHGDLQHENILVVGNKLRLIDYDGMFVPALAGNQSNELGHRNYQLPSRSTWDYGPYLDNFSAWVIYVSLAALAVHPELWQTYRGGDQCLIFRKEDFVKPDSSPILRDLNSSRNDQLRLLVDLFTNFFFLTPPDVPGLDGSLPELKIEPAKPWWGDFVPASGQEQPPAPAAQRIPAEKASATVDPAWIIEGLTEDKPTELVAFQSKPRQLRIVVVGSVSMAFLIGFFVELPPSEIFLWASCVFGLNVLLCFARWAHDPSRAEFKVFVKESKNFRRRLRQHQSLIDSIRAERVTVQEELARTERKLLEQKNRLKTSLQTELQKNQADLLPLVQVLNQRRQQARSLETTKLNSIQTTLGGQISTLDRKISDISQRETDETNKAIKAVQDPYIQNFLRSHSIAFSWITGIGSTYKARLRAAGFVTAADLNWNITRVNGIGPARTAALRAWRKDLENEALRTAPTISAQQKGFIENKYRQERQIVSTQRQQLQSQLNSEIASVRQNFADIQQSLNLEEQQIRATNLQKTNRISREYDSRLATIDLDIKGARQKTAPKINELSDKLRAVQKQSFALRWEAAKHSSEGRRFAALRFRDYVRKMISG